MSGALSVGSLIDVPDLDGRWSVWSMASDCPGAHFVVPADDKARATGVKFAVLKVTQPKTQPKPVLEVLRTDPAIPGIGR